MVGNNWFEFRFLVALLLFFSPRVFIAGFSNSSAAVSDNKSEDASIESLVQEMIDCGEPSTGHFSELELKLIDKRESALPLVIQMMTDERLSVRIHCNHILKGIAMKGFGWSMDMGGQEWTRGEDFVELWKKLGEYDPFPSEDESEEDAQEKRFDAQRLWRKYAELVRVNRCHVGEVQPIEISVNEGV